MTTCNALEDRLQHRRRRRWNRRARILAPFLALPLLLATLLLSIDMVEYRPEESNQNLMDQSIHSEPLEARSGYSTQEAISTTAFAAEIPITSFEPEEIHPFEVGLDLDLDLGLELEFDLPLIEADVLRTPTDPYAPRR